MRIPWSQLESALKKALNEEIDVGFCLFCGEEQEIPSEYRDYSICYACEERAVQRVENIPLNVGIDYEN